MKSLIKRILSVTLICVVLLGLAPVIPKVDAVLCKHSWSFWEISRAATCTTAGTKFRACSLCYITQIESIPAYGHSWSSWKTSKAATCTTTGTKYRTCTRCSAKQTNSIPAQGHSWSSWKTSKAATCTTAGSKYRTCTRCSVTETGGIPPLRPNQGHVWSTWKTTKAATCTTSGSKYRTCSHCYTTQTESIPPLYPTQGHDWYQMNTMSRKPTCGQTGIGLRQCKNCGAQEQFIIPATGAHDIVAEVHDTYVEYKCKNCKKIISKENINGITANFYDISEISKLRALDILAAIATGGASLLVGDFKAYSFEFYIYRNSYDVKDLIKVQKMDNAINAFIADVGGVFHPAFSIAGACIGLKNEWKTEKLTQAASSGRGVVITLSFDVICQGNVLLYANPRIAYSSQ